MAEDNAAGEDGEAPSGGGLPKAPRPGPESPGESPNLASLGLPYTGIGA